MQARPPKAPLVPAHPLYAPVRDEVVWNGRFPLQRVVFRYRGFDGALSGELTWELWRRGRAAVVLPYDPWTDRVALIEQFRLPALAAGLDPLMLEVPAGLHEPEETPAAATARELHEEAGLTADRYARIGSLMPLQGGTDELGEFSVARVRLPAPGTLGEHGLAEEHEATRVLVLDAAEAFALLPAGKLRNLSAAVCLLWLQVNHARLRDEWTKP